MAPVFLFQTHLQETCGYDVRALLLSGRQELFVPHGLTAATPPSSTPSASWSGLLDESLCSARLQLVSELAVGTVGGISDCVECPVLNVPC